jgi:hypothetical protein
VTPIASRGRKSPARPGTERHRRRQTALNGTGEGRPEDADHDLEKTDAPWFWGTDGTQGEGWNDNQGDRAMYNGDSAFRNDYYDEPRNGGFRLGYRFQ